MSPIYFFFFFPFSSRDIFRRTRRGRCGTDSSQPRRPESLANFSSRVPQLNTSPAPISRGNTTCICQRPLRRHLRLHLRPRVASCRVAPRCSPLLACSRFIGVHICRRSCHVTCASYRIQYPVRVREPAFARVRHDDRKSSLCSLFFSLSGRMMTPPFPPPLLLAALANSSPVRGNEAGPRRDARYQSANEARSVRLHTHTRTHTRAHAHTRTTAR